MKRFAALILCVLMVCASFTGCGGTPATLSTTPADSSTPAESAAPAAEKVVKVGVFECITGENGAFGYLELLGARYANEKYPTVKIGGEDYKVQLVEVDNKSDKTEAVTAAQSLVNEDVSIIVGSCGSSLCMAAGEIFADAKIAAISPSATNPLVTIGNDYYYRVCFIDPFQGTVMANYAFQKGYKTAAVVSQLGDDYTSALAEYFKAAFEKLGGSIVANEQYQANQTDFKAVLTNVKAQNPDCIFTPTNATYAPLLVKQGRELGITAQFLGSDGFDTSVLIEGAGADANGASFSTFFDESVPANDEAKAFIPGMKEYLKANGQSEVIAGQTAVAYDAYLVAIAAIEAAQSTDSETIQKSIGSLSVEGVTGTIQFDENGDAIKNCAFIKTVKDGAFAFDQMVEIK